MNEKRRQRIYNSKVWAGMKIMERYLDRYYLDALIGVIPAGIGDVFSALLSVVYIYFSVVYVRSTPLTLAILNNTLRDVMLGLIPFHIGDIIDIFHRSFKQNMRLVNGFVEDDQEVVTEVNKKARQSAIAVAIMVAVIAGLLYLTVLLAGKMISLIASLLS
ncbi:MAG: DUF4112 domain-containing protein [Prevotella sp.]|nr:DUF4112 domain-containing protein [Prevotella sp.]